eukprot:TRINITY_DN9805_c0_g1_i6.p1 TRINITY_DN9805_c0_g1~~TRINITY_DN9805_c0_g1_i6.p1  ORF type:complete len:353 (-),score=71.39 TRINITY_DN9805_c0_g1_i6:411-1469(-)
MTATLPDKNFLTPHRELEIIRLETLENDLLNLSQLFERSARQQIRCGQCGETLKPDDFTQASRICELEKENATLKEANTFLAEALQNLEKKMANHIGDLVKATRQENEIHALRTQLFSERQEHDKAVHSLNVEKMKLEFSLRLQTGENAELRKSISTYEARLGTLEKALSEAVTRTLEKPAAKKNSDNSRVLQEKTPKNEANSELRIHLDSREQRKRMSESMNESIDKESRDVSRERSSRRKKEVSTFVEIGRRPNPVLDGSWKRRTRSSRRTKPISPVITIHEEEDIETRCEQTEDEGDEYKPTNMSRQASKSLSQDMGSIAPRLKRVKREDKAFMNMSNAAIDDYIFSMQ